MISRRLSHDLCRFPRWHIDALEIKDNSVSVKGWALPFYDDFANGEIVLNSVRPASFAWSDSPDLEPIFPIATHSNRSRFTANFKLDQLPAILRISYVGIQTQDPFNKWTDIYFPSTIWNERKFAEPESAGMKRTMGHDNIFRYVMFGFTMAAQLEIAVQTYFGRRLNDFKVICDWGVGAGRVAQMVHYLAPAPGLIGLDVDRENVTWCTNNLRFGQYRTIGLYPPTDVEEGSIDLVYGISIFTHLKLDAFRQWIKELARMLRKGGVALVTINAGADLAAGSMIDTALVERLLKFGFEDSIKSDALDSVIDEKDYYRSTYITHRVAMVLFSEYFRVRDILRQANAGMQDLVVCERL